MADVAEGGGAALPPKRPTIIRPGRPGPTGDTEANGSPQPTVPAKPAPARPAPPPPAGGPGRPPPVDRPLPNPPGGRPPPPVPGRPAPSTEGHPPVPQRPTPATPPPLRPAPAADKKKANRNSVHGGEKKRLEITIVSARPMSEVGFRSEANSDKPDPPAPAPAPKPSVPEPAASQHSSKPPRPVSISRPPPPLSSLNPTPTNKTPPVPSPRSSVPAHPPRTEVPSPRLPPPHSLPPPVPAARPQASPQDHYESVPDSSPVYAEPDENVESKPSRGPPPTSRPPPVPASEARPSGAFDGGMEKEEGEGAGVEASSQSRPKRPTIIRPGRPQRPSASSDKTDSEKPARNSPSPPSAKKDTATEAAKKEAEAEDSSHRLPFKPKLRPTVVGRSTLEETPATSNTSSASGPDHVLVNNEVEYAVINKPVKDKSAVLVPKKPEVLQMPGEGEPPPIPPPLKPSRAPKEEEPSSPPPTPKPKPAPKPKPSILPKPKPAGGSSEEQDGGLMLGVTGHVREPEEEDVGCVLEKPAPSLPARKPTVIRKVTKTESEPAAEESNKPSGLAFPPKPARTPALGKDSEEEGGHAPPPRRPPSFIGQRKGSQPETPPAAVEDESSAAVESGAGSDQPPQPATRRPPPPKQRPVRPSSVAGTLSHTEKTSRPEEAAEEAKTPEALPHRLPRGAVPLPGMPSAAHEEPALRSRPPRPSGRPKSVAVFPPADTSSQLEDKAAPSPRAAQLAAELQKDPDDAPQQTKPEGPPRPEKTPGRPPPPSKFTPPPKQNRSAPSRPAGRKAGGKAASESLPLPPRPGPSHPLYHYTLCHPHAIAQHDFCTSQPGELPLKAGEVVLLLGRSNPEWLVGRVGHLEGMFPQNFVEVIHPLHDEVNLVQEVAAASASPFPAPRRKVEVMSGPRCEARFDFEGTNRGDLSFEEGDIIRLLERVGAEWLKGELGGVQGIFPASFVEIIEDLPSVPHTEDMTDGGGGNVVTAVFDFEGLQDELSFQAGQKVEVVGLVSEDWLVGKIGEHKGKFPATFVDRVPSDLPMLTPAPSDSDNQSTSALGLPSDVSSTSSHDSPRLAGAERQAEQSGSALARVVALYDFTSDQDGDLTFKEGDTISVLEYMDGDWLRGRMGGREGVFPKSFVDLGDSDSATAVGAPPSPFTPLGRARALYDFTGQDSSELSFKEGDIIMLGEFPPGNAEWCQGEVGGHRGLFPMAFVENLD